MKKNNIILIGIIVAILATLCVLIATDIISFKHNSSDNGENNIKTENKNEDTSNIEEKKVLYLYQSADINAINGNPATLKIYSMNDNEIEFEYHIVWNQNDILGKASKANENTYMYEKDNYKIEFIFDKIENDSVEITEYVNQELLGQINLFK